MLDVPSLAGASPWLSTLRALSVVTAIPVKDEEEHLPACLRALAEQRDWCGRRMPPGLVRVVLFANNCTDRSATIARRLGKALSLDIRVIEASLPADNAHAGAARRAAMDAAEAWLGEAGKIDGVILTTDADSRVAPNWIASNLIAFEAGADAVLGRIDLDEDAKLLPRALHQRGALEDEYEKLLTELFSLLDPLDHNPWPHHATISGASLGITCAAYRAIGGCPRVSLGEDKALIASLSRTDARIRYCPSVHVITSGRTKGRAPGGVADTLLVRSQDPDAFCDDFLEPFRTAFSRAAWRGRLRQLHRAGQLALNQDWPKRLGIFTPDKYRIINESAFGAAWALIETGSPLFIRRSLRPAELPEQISVAHRRLARLQKNPPNPRQRMSSTTPVQIGSVDNKGSADNVAASSRALLT
jgi:cellulose synthase/poly-beta-1,6-N-acetylglucosamine synthase-like glycosyltransferase